MPVYEYRCASCGKQFDKFVTLAGVDEGFTCEVCQKRCEKLISLPARPHVSSPEWLKDTNKAVVPPGGRQLETRQELAEHMKKNNMEFY